MAGISKGSRAAGTRRVVAELEKLQREKPELFARDFDAIEKPQHYNAGRIEVIDFIEDQQLNFRLGNTVKYIARSAHKGTQIADLKKARWYLDREITALEGR